MTTNLTIQKAPDVQFKQTIENNALEADGHLKIIDKDSKTFEQLKNGKGIELVHLNKDIINSLTNIVKLVQEHKLNHQNTYIYITFKEANDNQYYKINV